MDTPDRPFGNSNGPRLSKTPPKGIRVLPRTDQRRQKRARSFELAMDRAMVRLPPG